MSFCGFRRSYQKATETCLPIGSTQYLVWRVDVVDTVKLTSVSLSDYSGFEIDDIYYVNGTPDQTTRDELSKLDETSSINGVVLGQAESTFHYIVVKVRVNDRNVSGPYIATIIIGG